MNNSQKNISIKWAFLFIFFIVTLLIFIYAVRVQLLPKPDDNLLSDFAVYFSNWLMPFFTALTIIVLLYTFQHQRLLFTEEKSKNEEDKNSRQFQLYIEKSDYYLNKFKDMAQQPVAYSDADDAIIMSRIVFLPENSEERTRASEFIEELQPMMPIVKQNGLDPTLIPTNKFADLLFLIELMNYVGFSCRLLNNSYRHAYSKDSGLIFIAHGEVTTSLFEIRSWNLISDDEFNFLSSLIEIPEHLKEVYSSGQPT